MSLTKKLAITGTIWTILGYGGSQLLRLGGNVLLTRFLVPEVFGLMALVQTFINGLNMFSDVGIRPSIIRSTRGEDPVFLNTAWTVQVVRGFVLWIVSILIAVPIANFYGDSRLQWLVPIVALTTVISGFNSTSLATLTRRVDLGKLTRLEFGARAFSLAAMVIWAYFKKTIWALIGGNLILNFVKMLWSHSLEAGVSNRFAWDKSAFREIVSFGGWIFVSTAMTFLASQADRLILGKLFSFELLGVYTIAVVFADVPRQVVSRLSSSVILPLVSRYISLTRAELRTKILQKRWLLLIGSAIILSCLVTVGDLLISTLYDQRYLKASWMLPILSLGIWPSIIFHTINPVLLAIGKPLYGAAGNSIKFLYMVILLPSFFSFMGVLGVIIVIAFNDLPSYGSVAYGIRRERISVLAQDLFATIFFVGFIILACSVRYFLGYGLPLDGISSFHAQF